MDCTSGVFTFEAGRDAVDALVPDARVVGGIGPSSAVNILLHRCKALIQGNTTRDDGCLFSPYVPVLGDGPLPRYWLETLTDWPHLASTLAHAGLHAHLVNVSISGGPVERITLDRDGISYGLEGSRTSVDDPASNVMFSMYAGKEAEFLFEYHDLKTSATLGPSAMALTAQGGALEAIVPGGTTMVARTTSIGDLRVSDQG